MPENDPYNYARSPVEVGLTAGLNAAKDSYFQRAKYYEAKREFQMRREIKEQEQANREASINIARERLAETTQYHQMTTAQAAENAKEREKANRIREALRREQIGRSTTSEEREKLAAIRSGPGYAAEAGRQERFELTRLWNPELGIYELPPEETISEGQTPFGVTTRITTRRPRKGGKKTVEAFMPPK
jgi:hypothetical protein